jgi:hypothetical protein
MLVIKRLLIALVAVFLVVLAVIVLRTLAHQPLSALAVDQVSIQLDEDAMAERLSKSIRFKTVCHQNPQYKGRSQFLDYGPRALRSARLKGLSLKSLRLKSLRLNSLRIND